MPWLKIGRFRFDLDAIALVAEAVRDERDHGPAGVTVTLGNGLVFDLNGPEAEAFLKAFDSHVAAREIGRSPPRVLETRLLAPRPTPTIHPG